MQVDSLRRFRFHVAMHFYSAARIEGSRLRRVFTATVLLVVALAAQSAHAAALDPALADALKYFRTDGPKGWSFTQTTEAAGQSRLERYDAAQPEFNRWALIKQDGRAPTADELADYSEKNSRRSRGGTAPRLTDQLDLTAVEVVARDDERTTYRCPLKAAEAGDATGQYLRATLVLYRPTSTIENFTLASIGPFSPSLGVKIQAMTTTMTYSLPAPEQPSLLLSSLTRVKGTAFWFKSLDAERNVTFTDYVRARPAPRSK